MNPARFDVPVGSRVSLSRTNRKDILVNRDGSPRNIPPRAAAVVVG